MKYIKEKTYVKVIDCVSGLHKGKTGHVVGKRRDGLTNLLLTNHEKCAAMEVEILSAPPKAPKKRREKSRFEIFVDSLCWQVGMRGF